MLASSLFIMYNRVTRQRSPIQSSASGRRVRPKRTGGWMVSGVLLVTGIVAVVLIVRHSINSSEEHVSIKILEAALKVNAAVAEGDEQYVGAESPQYEEMSSKKLQDLVASGDVTAMIQLGLRFNYGPGEQHDFQKTKELMIKAASLGSNAAQGLCHLFGWRGKINYDAAFLVLEKGAGQGQETSMCTRLLARCYQYGWGVQADAGRAFKMYQQVAASGNPQADWALASCHLEGVGTPKSTAKALDVLKKYEDKGYWLHLQLIGDCYARGGGEIKADAKKAEIFYRKAAAAGYPDALTQVLSLRLNEYQMLKFGGFNGSRADPAAAEAKLNRAIAEGEGMVIAHPRSTRLRFKVGEFIIKRNRRGAALTPEAEALNFCAGCVEKQTDEIFEWQAGLYLEWLKNAVSAELQASAGRADKSAPVVPTKYVIMLENISSLAPKCIDAESKAELAGATLRLAEVHARQGDEPAAMRVARDVAILAVPVLKEKAHHLYLRNTLALAHRLRAQCAAKQGDTAAEFEARQEYMRVWGIPYLGAPAGDLMQKGIPATAANLQRLRQEMSNVPPIKEFVFPCDVAGARVPVSIFVGDGFNASGECQSFIDQVKYLAKERGVIVPAGSVAIMKRLSLQAMQSHMSFVKVLTDALNSTGVSAANPSGAAGAAPIFNLKS